MVHLASTAPHKQTARLLQLWQILQQRDRELPELVLVGAIDRASQQMCDRMRRVTQLPHLDQEGLVEKVGGARALLFPSEIEGFGLPALESPASSSCSVSAACGGFRRRTSR